MRSEDRRGLEAKVMTAGDPLLPAFVGWKLLKQRTETLAVLRELVQNLEKRLEESFH